MLYSLNLVLSVQNYCKSVEIQNEKQYFFKKEQVMDSFQWNQWNQWNQSWMRPPHPKSAYCVRLFIMESLDLWVHQTQATQMTQMTQVTQLTQLTQLTQVTQVTQMTCIHSIKTIHNKSPMAFLKVSWDPIMCCTNYYTSS